MGNTFKNSILITCNDKSCLFHQKLKLLCLKKSENEFIARHAGIESLGQQIFSRNSWEYQKFNFD